MRTLLLAIVLLASPAFAAETYSIPANDTNQALVESERVARNKEACASLGLSASCTQAQADSVRPGVVIYANTTAGRQALVRAIVADEVLPKLLNNKKRRGLSSFCSWWDSATQAQKDADCAKAGEAAGCELCP